MARMHVVFPGAPHANELPIGDGVQRPIEHACRIGEWRRKKRAIGIVQRDLRRQFIPVATGESQPQGRAVGRRVRTIH